MVKNLSTCFLIASASGGKMSTSKRSAPIGGFAYGIPRKARNDLPEAEVIIEP